jgi:hypothetical protein
LEEEEDVGRADEGGDRRACRESCLRNGLRIREARPPGGALMVSNR